MARKPYLEFSVEDRHISSKLYRHFVKEGTVPPLDKSGGCEACLMPFGNHGPIEGHREDYSVYDERSIVVICYRCHRVLHMRDRYPEGWEFYRDYIRRGWRWQWTKHIGTAAGDMRNFSAKSARLVNEPRGRTVLDDIHEGKLLIGTPEDRQARLVEMRLLWHEVVNGPSLF